MVCPVEAQGHGSRDRHQRRQWIALAKNYRSASENRTGLKVRRMYSGCAAFRLAITDVHRGVKVRRDGGASSCSRGIGSQGRLPDKAQYGYGKGKKHPEKDAMPGWGISFCADVPLVLHSAPDQSAMANALRRDLTSP